MRLWSLHPKYLDAKGLTAVWRETLLAKKVLRGKTKGYIQHPQLVRFKSHQRPILAIDKYLKHIFDESVKKGYLFKKSKIGKTSVTIDKITVNSGQIDYEFGHLKNKLKKRSPELYKKLVKLKRVDSHPLFKKIPGDIECWEKH